MLSPKHSDVLGLEVVGKTRARQFIGQLLVVLRAALVVLGVHLSGLRNDHTSHRFIPSLRSLFATLRYSISGCVAVLLLAATPDRLQGATSAENQFDIPSGEATVTLREFSAQAGVQLLVSSNSLRGIKTDAVKGTFTPLTALQQMLAHTELIAREDRASGAIAVFLPRGAKTKSEGGDATPDTQKPSEMKSSRNSLAKILLAMTGVGAVLHGQTETTNAPPSSAAGEEALELQTYTVTSANRIEKSIDRIPGAVNLIGSADIQQSITVTEDITKLLQQSLPGYSPSRGSRYTFGETLRGRTPLYLVDGIPQSTPLRNGSVGSYFVDLSLIERVEVINGPSATEGVGAAGGIINYITKKAKKEGNEINFDTKISSEFTGDNPGWRTGLNFTHSEEAFDLLVGAVYVARSVDRDANGKIMGVDNLDSMERDLFVKIGHNWGKSNSQRIQFSANRFDYVDNGNYVALNGSRITGIPNSAVPGTPLGRPPSNLMEQFSLQYTNDALFGGKLTAQLYADRENMLNAASIDTSKQDPLIAPAGTLVDQSEITAKKHGLRSIYVRPDFLVKGLEADVGLDYIYDETAQGLALTNRIWVPPLKYESTAPFAQLEYEYGPLTIRGGARNENAELNVDSYTTIATANRTFVQGGKLSFSKVLYNLGAIYRIGAGWSGYASYSEGFSVPDVGLALRGINVPNQTVKTRGNLTPLIITNKEMGVNWRGEHGNFGVAVYESRSAFGSSLSFDPVTLTSILSRTPTRVQGLELTGEAKLSKRVTLTAIYSKVVGKTSLAAGYPLDIDMSSDQISPDKLVGTLRANLAENLDFNFVGTNLRGRHDNQGKKALSGANLQEDFAGYTLFDTSLTYKTAHFGTWSIGVENLLNKYYIQEISSSNVIFSSSPPYFVSGRGRVVSLSNHIRF